MQPVRVVVIFLLVLATGCDDKPPTGPSQTGASTVTSLEISGADAVLAGLSASYTATAAFSDGTTRTVTAAWTSSDPGVGTVDSIGRLDGRTHGSTKLSARYLGRDASKTVHVVNDYGGTWVGKYVIRTCADTGDLTDHDGGWCASGPGRVGTVAGIALTLVQSGNTLSEITGTLGFYYCGTITGVVSADGRLTLAGTVTMGNVYWYPCEYPYGTLRLDAWDTTLDGNGGMTGGWSQVETYFSFRKGTAHTVNELIAMTRTSTSAMLAPASRFELSR